MTDKRNYIDPDRVTDDQIKEIYVRNTIKRLEGRIEAERIAHAEEMANTRAAHAGQLATYRTKLVLAEARVRDAEDRMGIAESKAVTLLQRLDDVAHRAESIAAAARDTREVHMAADQIKAVPVLALQRRTLRETTREIVEEEVPTVAGTLGRLDRAERRPGARGFGFLRSEMEQESSDVVDRIGGGSRTKIFDEIRGLLRHMVEGTRPPAESRA